MGAEMAESRVFGCGVDIEELGRFERYVAAENDSLMRDICSPREYENLSVGERKTRCALSFCCKEAFFKALGVSWTNSCVAWRDIELISSGRGLHECEVWLHGDARRIYASNRLSVGEATFCCNDDYVLFQIVLLGGNGFTGESASGPLVASVPEGPVCRPRFRP